jgi:hypothetical protein
MTQSKQNPPADDGNGSFGPKRSPAVTPDAMTGPIGQGSVLLAAAIRRTPAATEWQRTRRRRPVSKHSGAALRLQYRHFR